ncbi:DUF1385 domain-containing protein [Haliovirga abyssi]|uniref:Membrane protein n=1 Tax=Haliovirga abyssi TaxID=2996794 RepID=A0AAU9DA85_9FUSO|nr:DUF1385 domain-containing protein [Haliovirga abyssi]BDU50245.1 membrane protein [Haliovirga abyssi]
MGKKKKFANVGGQAVIEGVMMKGTDYIATAVRKPEGDIVYRRKKIKKGKFNLAKIPFIRGVFVLLDALILGTKELTFSAAQAGEEEEDELTDFQLGMTLFLSFSVGISLFFLLPAFIGGIFKNNLYANILEGTIRLTIFLGYVWGISFFEDIKRVFQYHGAEHKSIYAFENNEKLTPENAKKYSTLHPRCGTSFLLIVMLVSIIVFSIVDTSIIRTDNFLMKSVIKFSLRILFLPVIASISYEFQRFTSNHLSNPIVAAFAWPGLMLQRITTKEPDLEQLEVGIVALRAALGEENIENAEEITGEVKGKLKESC